MSLWLRPRIDHHRHPVLANVRQFYSFAETTGQRASVSEVANSLSTVPRNEAIRWLCSLSKGLMSEAGMTPAFQLGWARQIFPDEWVRALQSQMRRDAADAGAVFHRRSAWLILQLSVVVCKPDSPPLTNEEVAQRVGRACFMANDLVNEIDADWQATLSKGDLTEWMVSVLVRMIGSDHANVDFNRVGRAVALWEEAAQSPAFQKQLKNRSLPDLESAFSAKYGISLSRFIRFLTTLYVRLVGNQLEPNLNPLLLDTTTDEACLHFDSAFREIALPLVSQAPEDLAIRLLRAREAWSADLSPIRERPLLEIERGKCCCPDLTLFVRAGIDRVFLLLQDAYPDGRFRELFGTLFECYLNKLLDTAFISSGPGRVWLHSARFSGTNDEAADGVLFWQNSSAIMEFKAGQLSIRQRFGGLSHELLKGIQALAAREKKGVCQLAANIARILAGEQIAADRFNVDLSGCDQLFPVLVCFDESLGIHAVTKWLQRRFDQELRSRGVSSNRITPLMLLSVRDFENLITAANSVSIEEVLSEYATFLRAQDKDHTASFSSFLAHYFGKRINWQSSFTLDRHRQLIEELRVMFEPALDSSAIPGESGT